MRFSIILIIGIILLAGLNLVDAQPDMSHDLFDNKHYIIVGHVYEPYTQDNEVILINTKTGERFSVTAINCEHGLKEYLFNLANLRQGWTYDDEFILSYGNTTAHFSIIEGSVAYQQDIQRPDDVDPIFILTGFAVLAAGGGYFYMRKKKNENNEDNTEIKGDEINMNEEETEPITQETGFKLYRDFGVRAWIATLVILGYTMSILGCVYTNNMDVLKELSIAILPIVMVIIMFYFQSSSTRDMLEKLTK